MKKELCFKNKTQISYEILAYLSENPHAQDTIDGIIHWWLLERKIRYQSFLVKEALNDLVEQGFLLERKRTGIGTRYGMNRNKIKDIQKLIKQYLENRK